jgi:ribosome-binding protein aMBF1 (putative translation factor)
MSLLQDWNIIKIGNSSKKIYPKEIIEKRGDCSKQDEIRKVENETETFIIKTIPLELSKEITTIRNQLKLSQKDISNKLNIQQSVYTELENGKAIYNSQTKNLIQKIERTLNVKFLNKKIII